MSDFFSSHVRKLWIEGPAGRLEAALRLACPSRAVAVVAHPHPLHGGTLHNPVVFHADRELHRLGVTTLRINFRGVEGSEGTHDEGLGEVADIAAASTWVRALARDVPLLLVGYSFGSVCSIRHAASDPAVSGVIAIGLPVRRYPIDELEQLDRPLAVVQGTEDEFGSIEEVRTAIDLASPKGELHTIEGADHLFPSQAPEVGAAVVSAARAMLELPE
jgi:alpha/beta superfamily hydrolase